MASRAITCSPAPKSPGHDSSAMRRPPLATPLCWSQGTKTLGDTLSDNVPTSLRKVRAPCGWRCAWRCAWRCRWRCGGGGVAGSLPNHFQVLLWPANRRFDQSCRPAALVPRHTHTHTGTAPPFLRALTGARPTTHLNCGTRLTLLLLLLASCRRSGRAPTAPWSGSARASTSGASL